MAQNDFPASQPATGRDAVLAADLVSDAALAQRTGAPDLAATTIDRARTALGHAHDDVRVAALSALARLDAITDDLIDASMTDRSPAVRRRAVEALTALVDAEPTAPWIADRLLDALDDEPGVAEPAAFGLGEFGPDRLDPRLAATVERRLVGVARSHEDSLCREAAVAALGALHRGRSAILGALSDKATVRRRAVIALAPFDGADVDAALANCLEDRDWQVRQAAEDQIRARQPPGHESATLVR